MIDLTTLTTYTLVVLGFVFIPGPATLLTMARSTTSGTSVGIATGLGIAVGDVIHTAMAVIGISAIVYASSFMFNLVKYIGAVYLIYLGIQSILARAPDRCGPQVIRLTRWEAFTQAIPAELLNPKTALFFVAFLPQFVRPENDSVPLQLTILGIILVALGLLSNIVFAVSAGRLGALLQRSPAVSRWQGKVVGTIYCGVAVRLALQEK